MVNNYEIYKIKYKRVYRTIERDIWYMKKYKPSKNAIISQFYLNCILIKQSMF